MPFPLGNPGHCPPRVKNRVFGGFVGFLRPNSLGNNARVHPDSILHGSVIFYNFLDFSNFSYEKIKKIINCRDNFAKLCGDVSLTIIHAHTKFEAIWTSFGLVSRHLKKVV